MFSMKTKSRVALKAFLICTCTALILSACGGGSGSVLTSSLPQEISVPIPLQAKMTADATGNLYLADGATFTIVKVDPTGKATLVAGKSGVRGVSDGVGTSAEFYSPNDIAVDSNGNLYVTDSYKIDYLGSASVNSFSPLGSVYRAAIRKVTPAGVVTTLAGSATAGNPSDMGYADGVGTDARFSNPQGIAVDLAGNVFVADYSNACIRKINPQGIVTTYTGSPTSIGGRDGTLATASFNLVHELKIDNAGNLYTIHSAGVGRWIRKVSTDGNVTSFGERVVATNLLVNSITGKLYGISQVHGGVYHNLLYSISEAGVESTVGTAVPSSPTSIAFVASSSAATLSNGVISSVPLP
ncbi:MAG: SBBP repeat-containing protein [Sterolibacterium sp.]